MEQYYVHCIDDYIYIYIIVEELKCVLWTTLMYCNRYTHIYKDICIRYHDIYVYIYVLIYVYK